MVLKRPEERRSEAVPPVSGEDEQAEDFYNLILMFGRKGGCDEGG